MRFMSLLLGQFRGKRVWLTGHTGFKGAWLTSWLLELGAEVFGFSLPPPTSPALFSQLRLESRIKKHEIGDIQDAAAVARSLVGAEPHFVFHLAAQPLVRVSYEQPILTYNTNVMGTLHVLDALRALRSPCAAVMITTDKVYHNREWWHGYREEDPLGGYDPYSSSKAAAEIAIASFRESFFNPEALIKGGVPSPVAVASGRAGNVIGGGDWARDRIVPDCARALAAGQPIPLRNPQSTRPWQHVLEPLSGYLQLAVRLRQALDHREPALAELCSSFNFGPSVESNRSVKCLVETMIKSWPGEWRDQSNSAAVHEAGKLHLNTDKAYHLLGWCPRWDFQTTISRTVNWYKEASSSAGLEAVLTRKDILDYQNVFSL